MDDVVPIPGTTHRNHLEENVVALDVELDGHDLGRIDEVMSPGAASGLRYPESGMRAVNL
jgi:aryl-alcohol dehydrogenase-like predicted oxidoreductase